MKKLMMILLVFALLLGGCSKTDDIEDDSKYNLDAKYNVADSSLKFMEYTEDTLLAFPPAVSLAEFGSCSLPGYIHDDQFYKLDTNASSTCSLYNVGACDGIFYSNSWPIYYYKGKLYTLIQNEYNSETNKYETYIKRYELDGKNGEKLIKVNLDNINTFGNGIQPTLQFHHNKIYMTAYNSLFMADLNDKEMNQIEIEGVSGINKIILDDEILYVGAQQYNDGKNAHFNVVLECDLEGKNSKLMYENKQLQFIDEKYLFYIDMHNDTTFTSMLDRSSNEVNELDNNLYSQILKYEDTYLLDTDNMENIHILVLNQNGEIIGKKEGVTSSGSYAQVYLGNRYYVAVNLGEKMVTSEYGSGTVDVTWFGYYEITEDGISDLIMLDMPEEQ